LQEFEYVSASSLKEVVSLLENKDGQARILCGGTDLLTQMREDRRKVPLVVDIKRIPEVNVLSYGPVEGLSLGAAVSCGRICADPVVCDTYPGLVEAVSLIGGVQIQGRASIGGNLCNASPAADSIPALIVLGAVCIITGPAGFREVDVEDFCTGPGKNCLRPAEMLVSLKVPPPTPRFGAAYLRFIPRNEMDIAVVGAGASVALSESAARFESARIALGAVAPTPLYMREAGEWLAGRPVSAETIGTAACLAEAAVKPIDDLRGSIRQRKHLAGVLTRRALEKAVERAKK
jgi:CO/xanthine dehydrogenase FAD-binding subunit